MIGLSSQQPEAIVPCQGGYQFRFNIQQVTRDMDGTPITEWQYEYANVPDIARATLIDAMITNRYSYAAQLGKLACDRTSQEWLDYDSFRQSCYRIVDDALAAQ